VTRRLLVPGAAALLSLALAGCSWVPRSVEILDVRLLDDGRTLELSVASCNAEHGIEVQEDPESVAIWITAANDTDDDCADGITIELQAVLGDRPVVAGHDLDVLDVRGRPG
jgi:hypothetical protein